MFPGLSLPVSTGIFGLVQLLTYLMTISIAWYALGSVKWDLFLRDHRGGPAMMLRLIFAIVLGFLVGQFFLQYLSASLLLKYLR
ncbi:DUF1146 family protein [Effusibacillus lacus]|uniref:DUF1146 domain-containing protein n=1 Tax=Effusibacillus lacus TaxID=1348429 RepID=A0A292YL41_9BACL|nr:DUF1146 domain-containing protein [Effusibacillus lacus]TCS71803.1 putative integral membrane protein (TIGR02327 family) [Effusibacillus lacus]GAX89629.1 hypothetical protein EFBL_1253 [Effusibacillus lacus]